jgi:lipoprotein-anchoring transpeptidase ErfK/SrfK
MNRIFATVCALALISNAAYTQTKGKEFLEFDWREANNPLTDVLAPGAKGPAVLRAQILLDRGSFSPGEIDAVYGPNFRAAFQGFQKMHQLPPTEELGPETWTALNRDAAPVLVEYEISPEDVAGPFKRIPRDLIQQSALDALGYESPVELLGEKFHVSPKLLTLMNPGKSFDRAGERIVVPSVGTDSVPLTKAASVLVRKSDRTVSALDESGQVIVQFPASIGSQHDPLPIGHWKINGVGKNPVFHYNPKLFWDADPKHSEAKIAPGPNNPAGVVWIDLSKPHYGIHGTPEPSQVGHTQSHGCIRLTNWDAVRLAGLVHPGIPAILTE